jgi:hypothetical protein
MVTEGSSSFDSRSNCEPTHLAWESVSGTALVAGPVDTHLLQKVLRPSGTGELEPYCFGGDGSR